MRFTLLVSLVLLSACARHDDDDAREPLAPTLVFGIAERTDPATGQTFTTVGYEYLSIGWDAESFGHWAASRQSLPDGMCRRLDHAPRIERTHTGDGGRAHFEGGAIPAGQVFIDANSDDVTYAGPAFDPTRPMVFHVERGFGAPPFDPVTLRAPNAALQLTAPRAEATEIAVADGDLAIAWTSVADPNGIVMVALEPDDGAGHVRCWFGEGTGNGAIRADDLRGLGPGKMTISSHRNAVITPGDRWLMEVVATVVLREQRFVIR